jgi:hypothetical protein
MKVHKQRVLTFKENLVKTYGLIWDDYMTNTMQNRIEQHPDYASKIKNNPVQLMRCSSPRGTTRTSGVTFLCSHSLVLLFYIVSS